LKGIVTMSTPWHIREATLKDGDALARVQLESWRSAYADLLPADYLAHFTHEEQAQDWRDMLRGEMRDLLYVAEVDTGEVVGYALARPAASWQGPYTSELVSLHVLLPYKRQGIGRALIASIATALRQQNHDTLMLWVLKENPARAFYERLGGQLLGEQEKEIWHNTITVEVAYGWDDIARLCV
jgi:ribosomal protein S18 acetylase RimI-like enzyme